jgi:hypothetical protein
MRLWSLHPKYLDARGLVALWREGLLAQAVLRGRTKGYTRHPQLDRFRADAAPVARVAQYLRAVADEADVRGYRFDASKIARTPRRDVALTVTRGQLRHEWAHLSMKLARREPTRLAEFADVDLPDAHPMYRVVAGDVEPWERVAP